MARRPRCMILIYALTCMFLVNALLTLVLFVNATPDTISARARKSGCLTVPLTLAASVCAVMSTRGLDILSCVCAYVDEVVGVGGGVWGGHVAHAMTCRCAQLRRLRIRRDLLPRRCPPTPSSPPTICCSRPTPSSALPPGTTLCLATSCPITFCRQPSIIHSYPCRRAASVTYSSRL